MFPLFFFVIVRIGNNAIELFEKPYYDLSDAHNLFKHFIQEHGKKYDPEEYLHRLEIFKKSLIEINERNAIHAQSVFEVTRFADLAPDERYSNMLLSEFVDETAIEMHYHPHEITAPEQWDWRDYGAVTHVKNQGDCGSCWIFSATGAIEGQYAIKHAKTLAFSEQQSLDCINHPYEYETHADNCGGGLPGTVMAYHEIFGVVLEKDYPYKEIQSTCTEDPKKVVTKVTGYKVLNSTDEETLKQLVYEKGPLAVAIDPMDLTFHKKGILYPHHCTNLIGHAVLLVGYGIENGTKYWILKDSYGLERGNQGYFKLVRGINACTMGTTYTAYCTVA
ncbi:cathepsin L-like proteinase [Leguminivora glycinivorella]|uniref:cathepsin L-like proteinase n=1 Tax=Leguminivora glycinivorella TaxID=1035111 RepID=UPI0020105ED7|nr:cathepsin L-like proteinase [Leguminivora glycinivorella]